MRVISQDGWYDIPYEQAMLAYMMTTATNAERMATITA